MNVKLKQLKDIISESCVTIIFNTHRTHPNNQNDPIALKNLVKEAAQRLLEDKSKRDAKILIEKLERIEAEIDHNYNLDSLIIFVNEDVAEFIRLPIAVEDRVVIDHTFATRDLVRAMHLETNYYILILSQQKVRLIEAFNDQFVEEVHGDFPMENTDLFSTSAVQQSNASKQTSLVAEFFNRVDKALNEARKGNPLPVLICTEESNYYEFLKIADQKHSIYEFYLNMNRVDEKNIHITPEAWKLVKEHVVNRNNERISELKRAVGQNKFMSDANDIYKGINEGRVQTIFIEEGRFQPALFENNVITFVSDEERNKKVVVDDVFDELIEMNMNFGGDVVFLPKGELVDFDGFGAITRY
jgi:hypothetical protein